MAYLAIAANRPDELDLDLHGYRFTTGEAVIRAKIREAHANGFRAIRLIHGSSTVGFDSTTPNAGTLKAAVLAICGERAISRLLENDPFVADTVTVLFFKRNPRRLDPPRWTALPRPEFRQLQTPPPGASLPGQIPHFAPTRQEH